MNQLTDDSQANHDLFVRSWSEASEGCSVDYYQRATMNQLTDDSQSNHDLFVQHVRETGQVWGLKFDKGWAVCESNEYEDVVVYPFWSAAEHAQLHCTEEWSRYVPTPIALDMFLDNWLPGMHEDNALVGTNWDEELCGMELEPVELGQLLDDGD